MELIGISIVRVCYNYANIRDMDSFQQSNKLPIGNMSVEKVLLVVFGCDKLAVRLRMKQLLSFQAEVLWNESSYFTSLMCMCIAAMGSSTSLILLSRFL